MFLTNGSCFVCSTLKGKNGTGLISPTDSKVCGCLLNFVFNADNGVCECPEANSYVDRILGCVPCGSVANSLQTANVISKQCNCLPTFVWTPNVSLTTCNCPANSFTNEAGCFTCTKLKGKNGTGLVSTSGDSC